MGGGVAIDFALSFPQRLRALVLYDSTIAGFAFSPGFSGPAAAVNARARESGVEAARQLWAQNPMFKRTLQCAHSAFFKEIVNQYSGLHWLGKDSTRRYNPTAFERIGEIAAPTLVLVGEEDVPDMQAMADVLAQKIVGAQKRVLADAGHLGNLENPEGFERVVLDWLADSPWPV
jgi:pimeloyl-ACP methyl ester carboxylesterase